MFQESKTVAAIAKKTKGTITEDLGLTEIICPSAVPVTIENITKIALGEAAGKWKQEPIKALSEYAKVFTKKI